MFGKQEGLVLLAILGITVAASLLVALTSSVSFALATLPIELGLMIAVSRDQQRQGPDDGGLHAVVTPKPRLPWPFRRRGGPSGVFEPRRRVPVRGAGGATVDLSE